MDLELTPRAKKLLARRGFDPVLGARPLRRTIQREIEDQLSEKILFGEVQPGQIVVVDTEGFDENAEVKDARTASTADDKAVFTFKGKARPVSVTVPDAPPVDMAEEQAN
jgi:ATP-dependent Clp protease ATP-binding subunit ClpC